MDPLSTVGNADVTSRVGVAVARKALDVAEQQGQLQVDLIKAAGKIQAAPAGAVQPVGQAVEGPNLDVVA